MPTDEVKNELCEKIGKTLKEIEQTGLANEEFEVHIIFPDETWEWNITGWDRHE